MLLNLPRGVSSHLANRNAKVVSDGLSVRRFAKEHTAAVAGDYRQSAQQWLGSSWQGDALQVTNVLLFRPSLL